LFSDQRKFGWISADPAALPRGIDALDPQLTPKILSGILSSSGRPIKQILLDQSKIAGIGNIYASEILWQAKINPFQRIQKGGTLPRQGATLIHTAIRRVLTEAIDSGGSTMTDQLYRQVSGKTGNYWPRRRVYDRAGRPCRRPACRQRNTLIQKTVIAHRSTYFCPSCQSI
jgi:formamidopyrimidine-DNA glycosylase